MTDNARTKKLDRAVSAAGELIGFLGELGPINGAQAKLIIEAAVRACVPRFERWEIEESVKRVAASFESGAGDETVAT